MEANYFIGDGSQLTGIAATLDEIANNGNVTSNTILLTNTDVGLVATGNVEANYFIGDGSQLQNLTIPSGSGGVWNTNAEGEIYFATSNVGIANTDPGHDLSVGSNLYVDDDGSNVLVVNGNVSMGSTLTLDSFAITVSQGLNDIMNVSNTSSSTMQLTNADVGLVTTGNVEIGGELTISSNLTVSNVNFTGNLYQNGTLFEGGGGGVWTETGNDIYYTTGNVGIGTTNPGANLHVEGNAYISGTTISSELTESTSVSPEWAAKISGSISDEGRRIAVDGNGAVYVTGHYASSTLNVYSESNTTPATQLDNVGSGYDSFIAKYLVDGTVVWAANVGGSDTEIAEDISVDSSGNVYVIGRYTSSTLNLYSQSTTTPATQLSNPGGAVSSVFIAKYLADGTVDWATSMGGSTSDYGRGISVDSSGNVYVTGYYYSSTLNVYSQGSTIPATQLTLDGNSDAFIAKYLADGTVVWATKMTGTSLDYGYGISADSSGNVYVSGSYLSTTLNVYSQGSTTPATQLSNSGSFDAFIAKYLANGDVAWAAKIAGSSPDNGFDIAVDSSGNAYITGNFASSTLNVYSKNQAIPNAQLTNSGNYDGYIAKYLVDGTVDWAAKMSGSGTDQGLGIAVGNSGDVYVTGSYSSTTLNVYSQGSTTPATQLSNSGNYDGAFVAKYSENGTSIWAAKMSGTDYDNGYGVSVDSSGNVYVIGRYNSSSFNFYDSDGAFHGIQLTNSGGYDTFIAKYAPSKNSTTNIDSDNILAINTDLEVSGSVAGPFTTFLTGDVTTSIVTSIASTSTFYPLTSYTFYVPSEYHIYGTKNLEIYGHIKWCGEISQPPNSMFSARVYYGSGLTSYIDSAENTSSDASTRNNGAGVPAINYHNDFNSTLDSCILSSRFYIPNCPVSNGSQLKLEIRYRGGNSTSDVYTNRTSTDTTGDTNFERGTTNFFLAVK